MQRPTSIVLTSTTPSRTAAPRARILVVDDDQILCGLNAGLLAMENFSVETAPNGAAALERLRTSRFDLVLTDWNMPEMDGVGLVRAMRKAGYQIPVVMISGAQGLDDRLPPDVEEQLSVALPKPIRLRELVAAVEFALRRPPARPSSTPPQELFSQS